MQISAGPAVIDGAVDERIAQEAAAMVRDLLAEFAAREWVEPPVGSGDLGGFTVDDLGPASGPDFGAGSTRAAAGSVVAERLRARRRRARRVRGTVAGASISTFAAFWLVIYVQLASGHDPALTANAAKSASYTAAAEALHAKRHELALKHRRERRRAARLRAAARARAAATTTTSVGPVSTPASTTTPTVPATSVGYAPVAQASVPTTPVAASTPTPAAATHTTTHASTPVAASTPTVAPTPAPVVPTPAPNPTPAPVAATPAPVAAAPAPVAPTPTPTPIVTRQS
jgi:hypothetical protein